MLLSVVLVYSTTEKIKMGTMTKSSEAIYRMRRLLFRSMEESRSPVHLKMKKCNLPFYLRGMWT